MRKIHGYELKQELTSQNAGFCQWGFCSKDGHEYFIKEFLDPKFPVDRDLFSPEAYERKFKICEDFVAQKKKYYQMLAKCNTGNNVIVQHFFREGTKYYIITDKVVPCSIDMAEVSALHPDKKEVLLRSILYSVAAFHDMGLVHADLKADNILLKETADGFITAKIIDFDAGFLVGQPQSTVKGDFIYLSPEAFRKMNGEQINLTEKIDIFALGLLFHQYLTGKLPKFPPEDRYACISALNGNPLELSSTLSPFYRTMIANMLSLRPEDRWSARSILRLFEGNDGGEEPVTLEEEGLFTTIVDISALDISSLGRKPGKKGFYVPCDMK